MIKPGLILVLLLYSHHESVFRFESSTSLRAQRSNPGGLPRRYAPRNDAD